MNSQKNKQQTDGRSPNLYLVGFMGTGKSVVGKKVASLLKFSFVDSDKQIETNEGMKIPQIFSNLGEAHFRKLEKKFVQEEKPQGNTVISCGGGLVTNPELLEILKKTGVVVVLYAGIETLMNRIAGDPNRPLMNTDNPRAKIEELLKERENTYKNAGIGIMTDGHTVSEVADHIKRIYLERSTHISI